MITEHKEKIKNQSKDVPKSEFKAYQRKLKDECWVGFIYLIENTSYRIQKIGITGNPNTRLQQHKRNGFEIIEVFVGSPDTVSRIEHEFINFVNSLNIGQNSIKFTVDDGVKFDGYTESWKSDFFRIGSISSIVDISGTIRIPIPLSFRWP